MSPRKPPPAVPWPLPEQVGELQRQLGQALLRFQYVETALFHIAHCLMRTDYETSSLIFFHSKSVENKLGLINKLMSRRLTQFVQTKHWKPLRKSVEDTIEFRNALSHFEIVQVDGSKAVPPSAFNWFVSDHTLNEFAKRSGGTRGLSIEKIAEYSELTLKLSYRLIYFLLDQVPDFPAGLATLPQEARRHIEGLRDGPRRTDLT